MNKVELVDAIAKETGLSLIVDSTGTFSMFNKFLSSFKETDILHTYYAYDSPRDICIKLSYDNGNFLIIWANYKEGSYAGYIGEYLHDGSVLSFWGSFSSITYYEELVGNYFSTELI